jgi:D-3-phosphoglycerate dehydrogenase
MKVLVSDKISTEGLDVLKAESDIQVDYRPDLKPEEIKKIIGQYDGLVIRSGTKVTADIIEAADNLKAIARAGVGVDNVDVAAASKRGIIVMNTPGGNTVSTAEHTMAMLLALARNIAPAAHSLKSHKWDRKSYTGVQLMGKRIAVIGLGRVGKEVARRCKAFGMEVTGYDPYFGEAVGRELEVQIAAKVDDAVRGADFVTVHTPLNDETAGLINAERIALMADHGRVINCARGGIVDEAALAAALKSGKLAGAALDVYTSEPPADFSLIDIDRVLCTPHLGASTEEAQVVVAVDAARQLVDCLKGREIRFAVNMPISDWMVAREMAPYGELGARLGRIAAAICAGRVREVQVIYGGRIADKDVSAVTACVAVGVLGSVIDENVNLVNASILARDSGIRISETKEGPRQNFNSTLSVRVVTDKSKRIVSGTLLEQNIPRIIEVDHIDVEASPEGEILLVFDQDRPGLIAGIAKALGDAGINIARMAFGREKPGGRSALIMNLDAGPSADLLAEIRSAGQREVYAVQMAMKKTLPIA